MPDSVTAEMLKDYRTKVKASADLDQHGGERQSTNTHSRQAKEPPHENGIECAIREKAKDENISIGLVPARCAEKAIERHEQSEKRTPSKNHTHEEDGLIEVRIRRSQEP